MTQYILAGLTCTVLVVLWRWWITAYDLKKLQEGLTELQASTQCTKHNIDEVWKDIEALQSTVQQHHEALTTIASRASQQRSGAQPMQRFSPEAAAAARKRSTPRK